MYVGNDIVDFRAPEAIGKSGDLRFLRKALTHNEIEAVLSSDYQDRLFWAIWALKETAYKSISKADPIISASPPKYSVRFEDEQFDGLTGCTVDTPKGSMRMALYWNGDYVHCIGPTMAEGFRGKLDWDVCRMSNAEQAHESAVVRQIAKVRIADISGCNPADIEIMRKHGSRGLEPPVVYIMGKKSGFDISLSHHGRFAAYALWWAET